MFHTYITASSGNRVDFDRASWLMNRELLMEALDQYPADTPDRAQKVWDWYCSTHWRKYDRSFIPDFDPTWDQPHVRPLVVYSSDHPIRLTRYTGLRRKTT